MDVRALCDTATCMGPQGQVRSNVESLLKAELERFWWSYQRTVSSMSVWGEGDRAQALGDVVVQLERDIELCQWMAVGVVVLFIEETEPKEWVAHVGLDVLITFASLPRQHTNYTHRRTV